MLSDVYILPIHRKRSKYEAGRPTNLLSKIYTSFMATKLYVGNLSWNTTEDGLKDIFSQAGSVVSATIMTDRMTGRSRGFAFVEMGSDQEAQKAIESLNGKEIDGRAIVVNEAKPQSERPPKRDFNRRDRRF